MSACAGSRPEILPPPAPVETRIAFAPLDGALLTCADGPDLTALILRIEAVKALPPAEVPPLKKATLVIGIQGVALAQYSHALMDCKAKLAEIARTQKQP